MPFTFLAYLSGLVLPGERVHAGDCYWCQACSSFSPLPLVSPIFPGMKFQGWRDPFSEKAHCAQGAAHSARLHKGMCSHDIIGFECAGLSIMWF